MLHQIGGNLPKFCFLPLVGNLQRFQTLNPLISVYFFKLINIMRNFIQHTNLFNAWFQNHVAGCSCCNQNNDIIEF